MNAMMGCGFCHKAQAIYSSLRNREASYFQLLSLVNKPDDSALAMPIFIIYANDKKVQST